MKIEPTKPATSPLMWFAVLGAPAAWGVEFAVGYWVTQTGCSVPGRGWNVDQDIWGLVLMIVCFAVAVAAGLTAIAMFRGTRDHEEDDAPPAGRMHFLAAVGMTVTVLFIFIIVMTGLGILILPNCHQS
jgi:heme/copper-type cytochrome/quinol oxidase subunit 2